MRHSGLWFLNSLLCPLLFNIIVLTMQCKDIQLHCSSSYNLLPSSHCSVLLGMLHTDVHVVVAWKDSFLTALHVLYKKLVYSLVLWQWKVCKQMCQKLQPMNNISCQKKNIWRLCNEIWRNRISYQAVLLNVSITSDETLKSFCHHTMKWTVLEQV